MRFPGILRTWNDDRGFGFIAPKHGGPELFVHISAFPADGSRPVQGESVTYELGRGQNGKPQAVRVVRQAIGSKVVRQQPRLTDRKPRALPRIVFSVLVIAVLGAAYTRFAETRRPSAPNPSRAIQPSASPVPFVPSLQQPSSFRCDGRTLCTQMTSCAEATYFLKNCPGVKMDGNHDGVPCEMQWCKK
ncbi:MAG TPA: cold shock domain-containing protein [Ramlibacter sp.]|nr:cold shock domain-containing protein [Ramlibacter sp.]